MKLVVFINDLKDGVSLINLCQKHNIDCEYKIVSSETPEFPNGAYKIKIGKQRK
jgi:hypothetical protein